MNSNSFDEQANDQLALLGSEHGDYHNALCWFQAQGPAALPFLMNAFAQEGAGTLRKVRIVETLGAIGDPAAVPLLRTVLNGSELSWESAQALGKVGNDEAATALIDCLSDANLELVKNCIRSLGLIDSDAAAQALRYQLAHNDASLRYYAAQALIQAKPQAWGDALREHLAGETDAEVRRLIEVELND